MAGITLAQAQIALQTWIDASTAVAGGQSVAHNGRALTRANLGQIQEAIVFWDRKCKELQAIEDAATCSGPRRHAHIVMVDC
jgi:hypothetical protein